MISLKSAITRVVLNYFYMHPSEELYVNELARVLEVDKRNLVKKLQELEREGILNNHSRGNLKMISLNTKYPLFNEYKKIIMQQTGLERNLREIVTDNKKIKFAIIFGSYAQNQMSSFSDIDVLFVGDHSIVSVQRKLDKIQKDINREINAIHMSDQEFHQRNKKRDPFIADIFKKKHIRIDK